MLLLCAQREERSPPSQPGGEVTTAVRPPTDEIGVPGEVSSGEATTLVLGH